MTEMTGEPLSHPVLVHGYGSGLYVGPGYQVQVAVHSGTTCLWPSASHVHAGMTQVSQAQPVGRRVAVGNSQGVTLAIRNELKGNYVTVVGSRDAVFPH
jgi:hypothetical protein